MVLQAMGLQGVLDAYADFLARLVALERLRHRTRLDCYRVARRFLMRYASVALKNLTPEHIEQHLIGLHVSPRSMQTELMRLRAFFRWLVDDYRLLDANPCDRVHRPKWHAEPRAFPKEAQVWAVCRACRSVEEAALVEGFFWTGLRLREFQHVRVGQIDFARRRIVVMGKNGRRDPVFFPPHVGDLLRAQVESQIGEPGCFDKDAWLFPHPRKPSAPMRAEQIGATLRRLGTAAGLCYPLTAHVLRHACGHYWKRRTGNLAVVQRIMRHASIKITVDLYGPLDADDVQEIYDQHADLSRGLPPPSGA